MNFAVRSIVPDASSAASSSSSSSAPVAPKNDPLANEETFLKLLVSQIQNQDPLNPTDATTFVTQLTGYSQLEQLIGIRSNTAPASTSAGSSTTNSSSTSNTRTGTGN